MTQVFVVCEGADGEPALVFANRELADEWVAREQARLVAHASYWATTQAYFVEAFDLIDGYLPSIRSKGLHPRP